MLHPWLSQCSRKRSAPVKNMRKRKINTNQLSLEFIFQKLYFEIIDANLPSEHRLMWLHQTQSNGVDVAISEHSPQVLAWMQVGFGLNITTAWDLISTLSTFKEWYTWSSELPTMKASDKPATGSLSYRASVVKSAGISMYTNTIVPFEWSLA